MYVRGWRDSVLLERTLVQYQRDGTQSSISTVPGNPIAFSDLHRLQAQMCVCAYIQAKHSNTFKKKINLKIKILFNISLRPSIMVHALNHRPQKGEESRSLEACLVYTVSSRPASVSKQKLKI